MAFENLSGLSPVSYPASTGLNQYEAVVMGANGKLAAPADGGPILGVLRSITASTASGFQPMGTLYTNGMVAKVIAAAGVQKTGDRVSVSTAGHITTLAAGDYTIGTVVGGSSGPVGRIQSVALEPIGTT